MSVEPKTEKTNTDQATAVPKSTKQMHHRPLILFSKGGSSAHAQVYENCLTLIPHAKKDSVLATEDVPYISEIASDRKTDTVMYFEMQHRIDPFIWIANNPTGPSMSFAVLDEHSIEALELIGNCLKGSRPLIFFDEGFESDPVFKLAKQLLIRAFAPYPEAPGVKPFVDHALSFMRVNDQIFLRHYQIIWEDDALAEIGPRVTLLPHTILAGVMRGHKLWYNATYQSRHAEQKAKHREELEKLAKKRDDRAEQLQKKQKIPKIKDPMKGMFKAHKK